VRLGGEPLAAAAVSIAPVLLLAASAHIRASAFFFVWLPAASAAHVAFLATQIKSNYEQQQ
jgi:hypothetical protein